MSQDSSKTSTSERVLVCLNPNPSIDRTLILDELVVGGVNRATTSMETAGGKGAIVTRTTQNLGHAAVCCGPVGGRAGDAVQALAESEGLNAAWLPVAGSTRVNTLIVSNDGSPVDTVVNEAGPVISSTEWDAYCDLAAELVGTGGVACVSGSLPPGVEAHQAQRLVEGLNKLDCKVFVDSHGAALEAMAAARPWCIKVNDSEAAEFVGSTITTDAEAANAAEELAKYVNGVAIITLGGDGAMCATPDGRVLKANPVAVDVVSAVGSGDAFLAGLASETLAGGSLEDALRSATASGAANAAAGAQGVVSLDDVLALRDIVEISILQDGASS